MMKKTRRKLRLWSAMLALLLTVLYTLPAFSAVIPEETVEPQTNSPGYMQPLSSYQTEHSYDAGIVDGAVYNLRNVYHNTHMDVNGIDPTDGTEVSTYPLTGTKGTLNQQFKFLYLGNGIYEIIAMHSETNLHINAQEELVIYASNRGAAQRFRVQMLDSVTGVIFTELSGFGKALCFDVNDPNSVVQKTYSTLSDKTQAHWVFERVDTMTADMYAQFYIRHATGGQYIDVIEAGTEQGTLVHACPIFHANYNQEWKTYYDETDQCYYLKPGHRRDMALDYRGTHVAIYNDGVMNSQGYRIVQSDMDPMGPQRFAIKTLNGEYLIMGDTLEGCTVPEYRYIDTISNVNFNNPDEYNMVFCWILEGVPHDSESPGALNSVNNWLSANVEPGFMQEQYFCFTPTVTSRYKIELKDGNVDFLDITLGMGAGAVVLGTKTYNGIRVADVFCQAGATYYITVYSKNPVDGSTTTFSIRARQLTAVAHDGGTNSEIYSEWTINSFNEFMEGMGFDVIFDPVSKNRISAEQALNSTSEHTGYDHFNSEIFLYSGHGSKEFAWYNGTNEDAYLSAQEIPDMSNCELAIWGCCQSAKAPLFGDSMAEKSYEMGAKIVLSWSEDVNQALTYVYVTVFFNQLKTGATVSAASNAALSQVSKNENVESFWVDYFIEDFVSFGNLNKIIYPIATNQASTTSANTMSIDHTSSMVANADAYVLVAENECMGWKMYARMINGIMANDYYIEFYEDGVLTNVSKSAYTMTEADVMMIETQMEEMGTDYATIQNSEQSDQSEYLIRCIDGEWRLVERVATHSNGCDCCAEYTYYDALTGEEVA